MTGASILIECLIEQGVDTVFGYPGGAILNVYDALYQNSDRISHYLTSHEQGASHAADGYARSTGKVGVCLATSGPGATNLVTGIATAYMDSVPMVAITCNVASPLLGRDSFQEVDIAGITMPVTKHNYIVKDVTKLADIVREAFYIAKSGRPGPVLIDIPKDITAAECDYTPETPKAYQPQLSVSEKDLQTAISLIEESKKPFIISGGGVIASGATSAVIEFARKLRSPVATSLMGIGSFPANAPQYTGMIGMHGTKASNMGVTHADLIIAVGMRFSDRVISDASKFAHRAKILHIDIDAAEIDKNVPVYHALVGDAKLILEALNAKLSQKDSDAWMQEITAWKHEFPPMDTTEAGLNPQFIMETIYHATNGEAVITTEVGQHQMWAAQFYHYDMPRTFISSGGLGTMGYGTGASIGAQLGNPEKQIVSIAGDGSFRMNCNELATVRAYNLPIIYVIMNNNTLGMVRQWQTLFYDKRYSQTTLDERGPDFVKLAEAFGIQGVRADSKESFQAALKNAVAGDEPVLIEACINQDSFVLPMVAPGRPIEALISNIEPSE